ncbi:hypothetical protein ACIBSV_49290 [Embleya sp. NPDC050154]|uniref:hypothetical protein n=1 Tax=Embleya sp. NPDC050154 TaxID=3363988 RepID=UPI00378C9CAB
MRADEWRRHRLIAPIDRRANIRNNSFVGEKLAITPLPYSGVSSGSMVFDTSFGGAKSWSPRPRSPPAH